VATNTQVTADPLAGVAVIVTVAPVSNPVRLIVGVLSAVMLSVDDIPVSEEVARSGAEGALTLVLNATSETNEIFPALSRTTIYAFKLLPCVSPVSAAVFVDANEGALLTVVGKVGAIDLEAKTVRIDLTAVSNELAVLGKAQAVVKL
jgi:hypothetical protein